MLDNGPLNQTKIAGYMSSPEKREVIYKVECANCNAVPTERYILIQRLFTFFDEWLFYLLLAWLYVNNYVTLLVAAAVIGGVAIINSYSRLWKMEDVRFGGKTKPGT